MTVFVGDNTVVQFRPYMYKLDQQITDAAQRVYQSLAPETTSLGILPSSGLLAYSMTRVRGMSLTHFRATATATIDSGDYLPKLCRDFAALMAKSWFSNRDMLPDAFPQGRIGASIIPRLKSLSTDLPIRFQPVARYILRHIHQIEELPQVFTHGDLLAGNIMVDSETGHLTGLVDWAEAEALPFGVCFYGLEEILGTVTDQGFCYDSRVNELRELFWTELTVLIPELRASALLEKIRLARDLGVLLWYGIAFDNGSIDRVVQEGRDVEEIQRLDAFLDLESRDFPDMHSKI